MKETFDEIACSHRPKLRGLPTGIPKLDSILGGIRKGKLTAIVGDSFLCSVLTAQMCLRLGKNNFNVHCFCSGISDMCFASRLLYCDTGITLPKLENGGLEKEEWPRILESANEIGKLNIAVADLGGITPAEVSRALSEAEEAGDNLGLVLVDGLLEMRSDQVSRGEKNTEVEMEIIVSDMKKIAEEFNVEVVVSVQMDTVAVEAGDTSSARHGLRDIGYLDLVADTVISIRHDAYRDQKTDQALVRLQTSTRRGRYEAMLLKNDPSKMKLDSYSVSSKEME